MTALRIRRLCAEASIPRRANRGDAGYDLATTIRVRVEPFGGRCAVPTGLAITVPEGTYGRVAPRSGIAARYGIDVLAGVVDRSYTGEVRVLLVNHGEQVVQFEPGERVAQLILERCETPEVEEVAELDETERGAGGFGSSGT